MSNIDLRTWCVALLTFASLTTTNLAFSKNSIQDCSDFYAKEKWSNAIVECKKSATDGEPVAQLLMGLMYRDGNGVAQDHKQAVVWFQLAAQQGEVEAQRNLGTALRFGYGSSKNVKQAIRWYKLAADQGNITLV